MRAGTVSSLSWIVENLDRRKFLKQSLFGAIGLGSAAAVDGFLIEPHLALPVRISISLPRLPEVFHGFRIAQICDIHFGPYMGKTHLAHAVRLALAFKPDLTILTGDFVTGSRIPDNQLKAAEKAVPCAEVLQQLTGAQVVSVLGNHDHWTDPDFVTNALDSHGLHTLRNRSVPVERSGQRIWIVGVDDVYEDANDLPRALEGIPPNEVKIVAVHEPDFADVTAQHSIDLQLSGHSHGGQVRIPGYGAPILPPLARKYPIGLRRIQNLQLYTNRGLGVVNPPVRFNCPPEVTLITLVGRQTPSSV
jgi:predicted MPP superfamily phosphohydrolase